MYKMEFVKNEIGEKILRDTIPETPFVVEHRIGNIYIVTKLNDSYKYLMTNNEGVSFDGYYTKEKILNYLNNGNWILRESQLIIK